MSDQLEPELERVAQMLAAAGPLPAAPESLRGARPGDPRRRPRGRGRGRRAGRTPVVAPAASDRARGPGCRRRRRSRSCRQSRVLRDGSGGGHSRSTSSGVPSRLTEAAPRTSSRTATATRRSSSPCGRCRAPAPDAPTRRGSGARAIAAPLGTFSTDANGKATITFRVPRKELDSYRWLWVTSEPAGGSAKPSDDTALWGPLT